MTGSGDTETKGMHLDASAWHHNVIFQWCCNSPFSEVTIGLSWLAPNWLLMHLLGVAMMFVASLWQNLWLNLCVRSPIKTTCNDA